MESSLISLSIWNMLQWHEVRFVIHVFVIYSWHCCTLRLNRMRSRIHTWKAYMSEMSRFKVSKSNKGHIIEAIASLKHQDCRIDRMYCWSGRKYEISGHVQAVPYLSSNKVPVRIPSEFASSTKLQSLELHLYTNCCQSYYSFGEKFEGKPLPFTH